MASVQALSQAFNGRVLSQLTSSKTGSEALRVGATDFPATVKNIQAGLRTGARRLVDSFVRINDDITALNLTQDKLESLDKITTKVIALAKVAESSSTPGSQRRALDIEFQKLASKFVRIIEDSSTEKIDLLTRDGLSDALKASGLDKEGAAAIADFYKKFKTLDGKGTLADETIKGNRPVPLHYDQVETSTTTYDSTGFTAPVTVLAAPTGNDVAANGDFDNDGNLDLVLADSVAGEFYFIAGNGDGTFKSATTFAANANAINSEPGDFTGDGNLDLFISNYTANHGSFVLGNGDGTFGAPVTQGGSNSAGAGVAADFNNDGHLDFALTSQSFPGARIYLGNGDGTFDNTNAAVFAGSATFGIRAADFNEDGYQDLVLSDPTITNLSVFAGSGTGTFSLLSSPVATGNGTSVTNGFLDVGDLNGDGHADIVVPSESETTINVLLGNGDGTFAARTSYALSSLTRWVELGDYNLDGSLDIFTVSPVTGDITILKNNGDGTFAAGATASAGGTGYYYLSIGDFNKDGGADFAVSGVAKPLKVYLSNVTSSTVTTTENDEPKPTLDKTSLFTGGRNIQQINSARAVRIDAEALHTQIQKNIKVVESARQQLTDTAYLIKATRQGLLTVSDTIQSPATADEVAARVRSEIRAQDRRFSSFLDPVIAATLLNEGTKST